MAQLISTIINGDLTVTGTVKFGSFYGVGRSGSVVANRIPIFNDTNGNIKDSGFTIASSVPANAKFTDTTYSTVTTSANGLMSSTDKSKLDGIAPNANNYSHPTSSGNKHIPSGGSTGQILRWSADGTAVWGTDNDTKYSAGKGLTLSGTTFNVNIGTGSTQVAAGNHTHNYLPLTGGTITGTVNMSGTGAGYVISNGTSRTMMYSSTTIGEHIFGGSNNSTNEVTDYIRIGANKLQYQTNGASYDIYHAGRKPTPSDIGAAASSHTHNYAGSSSAGGAATSALTCTGNSATATKLATARKISLTGGATGSGTFDGSGDISISTTVNYNNLTNKPSLPTIKTGNGTLNSTTPVVINIGVTLPNTSYHVSITPTSNPDGSLGEVYVTNRTKTSFSVVTTGSTKTTTFSWMVVSV